MKMLRFAFGLSITASIFLFSCDIIEEPYLREGEVPHPDTSACPVPEFPAVPAHVQNVLLEDYTAHKCPNCPEAAILAHDLSLQWGGRLKIVAIHAGLLSSFGSAPYTMDFTTTTGDDWDQTFGISNIGNPNGMINRFGYSQTHIVGPSNWASRIQAEMQSSPAMMLQLITDYTDAERKLCAHVRVSWLENTQEVLNLVLILTEDSIVAPQKNNNPAVGPVPDIMNYVHMHILRDAISGTWGKQITCSDTLTMAGNEIIKTYRYDLPEAWRADQCAVVAFVYKTANYQILQVADTRVLHH